MGYVPEDESVIVSAAYGVPSLLTPRSRAAREKQHDEAMRALRSSLQSEFAKKLAENLAKQRAEMEASAEKARSELEMKMVRLKEKALADQTVVFKRELAAGEDKAAKEKKMLVERVAKEKAETAKKNAREKEELRAAFEKEAASYKQKIAELKTAVETGNAALQKVETEKHQKNTGFLLLL